MRWSDEVPLVLRAEGRASVLACQLAWVGEPVVEHGPTARLTRSRQPGSRALSWSANWGEPQDVMSRTGRAWRRPMTSLSDRLASERAETAAISWLVEDTKTISGAFGDSRRRIGCRVSVTWLTAAIVWRPKLLLARWESHNREGRRQARRRRQLERAPEPDGPAERI
jgi:hypothetical protein